MSPSRGRALLFSFLLLFLSAPGLLRASARGPFSGAPLAFAEDPRALEILSLEKMLGVTEELLLWDPAAAFAARTSLPPSSPPSGRASAPLGFSLTGEWKPLFAYREEPEEAAMPGSPGDSSADSAGPLQARWETRRTAAGLHLRLPPHVLADAELIHAKRTSLFHHPKWSVSQDQDLFGYALQVRFPYSPILVPEIAVAEAGLGGKSSGRGREQGLRIRGEAGPFGYLLGLREGRGELPVSLHLESYRPLRLPLGFRSTRWEAGGAVRLPHGAWAEYRFSRSRLSPSFLPPSAEGSPYFLQVSGAWDEHRLDLGQGRLRGEAFLSSGGREWEGLTGAEAERDENRIRRFSYLDTRQKAFGSTCQAELLRAARSPGAADSGEGPRRPADPGEGSRLSALFGFSRLELEARRSEGKKEGAAWNRNAILDAYSGALLGLFDRENWYFDGDFHETQVFGGLEAGGFGLFSGRIRAVTGLSYLFLEQAAYFRLLRHHDQALFFREVSEDLRIFPILQAHFAGLHLRLRARLGKVEAFGEMSQLLPVHHRLLRREKEDPGAGTGEKEKIDTEITGGTRIRVGIGL